MTTLAERCLRIEMLVLDVDGVLTEGSIIYGGDDVELKKFHVRDGSGLKIWEHQGKRSAIITGRRSRIVDIRAAELGIKPVFQGAIDKLPAYREILTESGLNGSQVGFLGDDVLDVPVMRECGLAVAVADSCSDVLARAHYVTRARGGRGAVRETIELILRCQGCWPEFGKEKL